MTELPLVSPPASFEDNVVVPGVLLAAGTSSRFGSQNKLLASLDGTPIVRLAAQHLIESQTSTDHVIVGYEAPRVKTALSDLSITIHENSAYSDGQAASVRTAMNMIDTSPSDGVLFALGDMPRVKPSSINALIKTFSTGDWTVLAAAMNGTRGNPVLFDAMHFSDLETVNGDTGARNILLSAPDAALVETGDPGVTCDIDTQADLAALQSD